MARIRGVTQALDFDPFTCENLDWSNYTSSPTIYSGSGSITLINPQFAYYIQLGDIVFVQSETRLTLSGVDATTIIGLNLPVAPNYAAYSGNQSIGTGIHVIASNNYFPTRINLVQGDSVAIMAPANFGTDVFTTASNRWHRWTLRYRAA